MATYTILKKLKSNDVIVIELNTFIAKKEIKRMEGQGYINLDLNIEASSGKDALSIYHEELASGLYEEAKGESETQSQVVDVNPILVRKNTNSKVVITDIDMPFLSMVMFMVKFAIASIPAAFILGLLYFFIGAVVGGMFMA
ncbi:TPA: hypothetical protein NJ528_004576 [Vibrio parahaemolyticus]|nr:hypothetical protein [Vibrio parahaemolyticus]HCG8295769.1 hypothetical protein [Vibrio parahaemolyticus]HCG8300994.1 hypothetical protein [Vibrio parahaemolyticus]HCG8311133.1 hypothetical protein [Vibrio parahaemolyticus]HCH0866971.1 hypothetical protein [Vibrio parahaemolyticus]